MRALMVSLSLWAICLSPTAWGAAQEVAVEEHGDGLYTFRYGLDRSLFLIGKDGVVVTDPLNAHAAERYRAEIATLTDLPVTYVVYSHSHWDRISGAQVFTNDGAKIVAHEQCAETLADNPNPNIIPPDITFEENYEVDVGGVALELFFFGPSHSECLVVMLAKPANMLMLVDLVDPPAAAIPSEPTVPHIKPWNILPFFKAVETLAEDRGVKEIIGANVVYTEGGNAEQVMAPTIGPVSLIAEQQVFWRTLMATVHQARLDGNVGNDSFVLMDEIDLTPFEAYQGYDQQDLAVIMRRFVSYEAMGR